MEHKIFEIRDKFKGILDTLVSDYGFSEAVLNSDGPEDIFANWKDAEDAEEKLGLWFGTGATKFVIGVCDYDFVLKFTMCGYDYCEREVDIYNAALEEGFEKAFAWAGYLFDYDFGDVTVSMYAMERCDCDDCQISDDICEFEYREYCTTNGLIDNSENREKFYCERDYDAHDETVMDWACEHWGIERCTNKRTVVDFMREMYINDIHCGNWGWSGNRLVLVDYSGYGSDLYDRNIRY
jgi:hypothetical protein